MIELNFDSLTQLQIFFYLCNNKPSQRKDISKNTGIPRTTVYDNLVKLHNRCINTIPYVAKYTQINTCNNIRIRSRPLTFWFIPRGIKRHFFTVEIPKLLINGVLFTEL